MHSRPSAIVSILAVCATALAFSMPAAQAAPAAAKTQKVRSSVSLTDVKVKDDQRVTFVGKVKAKKAVCTKGRTVKVRSISQGINVGKDKTNKRGIWRISFNGNKIQPGKFKMTVTKKVVKKGGKRIVCKAASKTRTLS